MQPQIPIAQHPTPLAALPKEQIVAILKSYGVLKASIFGSYARGEQTIDSDLDILVEYSPSTSLFNHFDLKTELENALGLKVDVVSIKSVSRHLAPYIERDKQVIL